MTARSLHRRVRAGLLPAAMTLVLVCGGNAALAHSPNPLFGSIPWNQDQIVGYQWWPGSVPPSWMATAIDAGAADVGQSRNSRAATFTRVSSSNSRIAYGGANPCPSYGIACMDRTGVPDKFAGMWFRPQGWPFDWGSLRWCQGLPSPANGCYDAENVTLDEFGHVEILGHHVNYSDESDFLDSVVQYAARSRPKAGWNEHVFGRCDVARLQLEYALEASDDLVSTCLSLATSLSIVPSATQLQTGQAVRITGNLKIAVVSAARSLSGDPLSGHPGGPADDDTGQLWRQPDARDDVRLPPALLGVVERGSRWLGVRRRADHRHCVHRSRGREVTAGRLRMRSALSVGLWQRRGPGGASGLPDHAGPVVRPGSRPGPGRRSRPAPRPGASPRTPSGA